MFQVNKLLCLCSGSLCNNDLPHSDIQTPEGGLEQGLAVISLVVLLLIIIVITGCLLVRLGRRTQPSQDSQTKVEAALPGVPPPYVRMYSAPAALSCDLTRPAQPRNKLRGSLETLLKPFLKSSLSYEKSASRNTNKRLETEV